MASMTDELDTRRRRALYRAQHRGTKEMDLVVGGYAAARLAAMSEAELATFERLLVVADPEIEAWVFARYDIGETELAPLIDDIRRFHGLSAAS